LKKKKRRGGGKTFLNVFGNFVARNVRDCVKGKRDQKFYFNRKDVGGKEG